MQRKKPTMTSLEAAALIATNGMTDDPEQANLMAEGKLLDPDALVRAHFRRAVGFDFDILTDIEAQKVIARDSELGIVTTASWIDNDDDGNAQRMAKAVMKLKKLHERAIKTGETPEAEVREP